MNSRYSLAIALFISIFLYSCSSKAVQEQVLKDSLFALAMADSIASAKGTAVDSSCSPALCKILDSDEINSKRLDSLFAADGELKLNCYCEYTGTRKKVGARIPIIKEFVKDKYRSYQYSATPLQVACQNGDYKVMKKFLEKGADPNLSQNEFSKPMNIMLRRNDSEGAKLLGKYKGNIKGCYVDVTFLSVADLKMYSSFGADYNRKDEFFQEPPVQQAKEYAQRKYLLEWGANPNDKGKDGSTLLHKLVIWGDPGDIELALKYNADLYARDDKGNTPLHIAAGSFDSEMLMKLYPLYDLKKANITVDELMEIAVRENSEENIAYLKKKKK